MLKIAQLCRNKQELKWILTAVLHQEAARGKKRVRRKRPQQKSRSRPTASPRRPSSRRIHTPSWWSSRPWWPTHKSISSRWAAAWRCQLSKFFWGSGVGGGESHPQEYLSASYHRDRKFYGCKTMDCLRCLCIPKNWFGSHLWPLMARVHFFSHVSKVKNIFILNLFWDYTCI